MIYRLDDKIIKQAVDLAAELKTELYVIGGFVRDLFLKRKSKDIDFVVVGSGIDFVSNLPKR